MYFLHFQISCSFFLRAVPPSFCLQHLTKTLPRKAKCHLLMIKLYNIFPDLVLSLYIVPCLSSVAAFYFIQPLVLLIHLDPPFSVIHSFLFFSLDLKKVFPLGVCYLVLLPMSQLFPNEIIHSCVFL